MTVTLDGIIRQLEGENPPDVEVKSEPARMPNQKPHEVKPAKLVDVQRESNRDFINLDSKEAYPTLSKVLGFKV